MLNDIKYTLNLETIGTAVCNKKILCLFASNCCFFITLDQSVPDWLEFWSLTICLYSFVCRVWYRVLSNNN